MPTFWVGTIRKPLAEWSNRDFLFYFSDKLERATGSGLDIPPVAWQGFMGRIKGFRNKLKLSPEKYKEFVDVVFSDFFTRDGYVPTFGAIVSERVYSIVQRRHRSIAVSMNSTTDFEAYRRDLYSNNLLFSKVNLPHVDSVPDV